MPIDTVTVRLLNSVLGTSTARSLFSKIAAKRIAEVSSIKQELPDADRELNALEEADLIGTSPSREKYYVTARGLKVERDLEKLALE